MTKKSLQPTLVTNPTDDIEFANAAAVAVRDATTIEQFQASLRARYPNVLARARALSGESLVWYVYRDGHWIRSSDRG